MNIPKSSSRIPSSSSAKSGSSPTPKLILSSSTSSSLSTSTFSNPTSSNPTSTVTGPRTSVSAASTSAGNGNGNASASANSSSVAVGGGGKRSWKPAENVALVGGVESRKSGKGSVLGVGNEGGIAERGLSSLYVTNERERTAAAASASAAAAALAASQAKKEKRGSWGGTLVNGAMTATVFSAALGLTAYRLWSNRGLKIDEDPDHGVETSTTDELSPDELHKHEEITPEPENQGEIPPPAYEESPPKPPSTTSLPSPATPAILEEVPLAEGIEESTDDEWEEGDEDLDDEQLITPSTSTASTIRHRPHHLTPSSSRRIRLPAKIVIQRARTVFIPSKDPTSQPDHCDVKAHDRVVNQPTLTPITAVEDSPGPTYSQALRSDDNKEDEEDLDEMVERLDLMSVKLRGLIEEGQKALSAGPHPSTMSVEKGREDEDLEEAWRKLDEARSGDVEADGEGRVEGEGGAVTEELKEMAEVAEVDILAGEVRKGPEEMEGPPPGLDESQTAGERVELSSQEETATLPVPGALGEEGIEFLEDAPSSPKEMEVSHTEISSGISNLDPATSPTVSTPRSPITPITPITPISRLPTPTPTSTGNRSIRPPPSPSPSSTSSISTPPSMRSTTPSTPTAYGSTSKIPIPTRLTPSQLPLMSSHAQCTAYSSPLNSSNRTRSSRSMSGSSSASLGGMTQTTMTRSPTISKIAGRTPSIGSGSDGRVDSGRVSRSDTRPGSPGGARIPIRKKSVII